MSKFGDLIKGKASPTPEPTPAPAPEPVVEVTERPDLGEDTTSYEEVIEEEYAAPDLDSMSKLELEAYGREIGIELDRRHSKNRLIEEILEVETNS